MSTQMNTRYKITRLDEAENPLLTLEQCKAFFEKEADFSYMDHFIAKQNEVNMKLSGDFFMWHVDAVQIPFRFYDGELYVAISHPAIFEKMVEIAAKLEAVYVEG